MRVTNYIIRSNAVASIQSNLRRLEEAQSRVTTGLKLRQPSDDPTGAGEVLRAGSSLRALDQYRRNIDFATSRLEAEESVLDQVTNLLARAKELGMSQASGTADHQTRTTTKAEVDGLLDHLMSLSNTKVGDDYLFGGSTPGSAPVAKDVAGKPTVAPTVAGEHRTEIAAGQTLKTTHNAQELFADGQTDVFKALWDLSQALGANDQAAIADSIKTIDSAHASVQTLIGDVGAKYNQLQVTHANLDALEINLRTFKSNLEDADLEKAVTELVARQTAFQSAMLATSRVLGMNLAEYLR